MERELKVPVTRARYKQRCAGMCERYLRKGRLIFRVWDSWMCENCARMVLQSAREEREEFRYGR